MALETIRQLCQINGVDVAQLAETASEKPSQFIIVNHELNSVSFAIQNGPIKENGVNGCQVDELVAVARAIISGLNKNFPCRENSLAITKLDEAMQWLRERTRDREKRGVEGHNKE